MTGGIVVLYMYEYLYDLCGGNRNDCRNSGDCRACSYCCNGRNCVNCSICSCRICSNVGTVAIAGTARDAVSIRVYRN